MPYRFAGVMCLLSACASSLAASAPSTMPAATTRRAPPTVLTDFYQDRAKNCSAVGLLKAVISEYGDELEPAVHVIAPPACESKPSRGLSVRLRDGKQLELTCGEIANAGAGAGLELGATPSSEGAKRIATAKTLFAIMVKSCQVECMSHAVLSPNNSNGYCDQSTLFRSELDLCNARHARDPQHSSSEACDTLRNVRANVCTFDNALSYVEGYPDGVGWNLPPLMLGLSPDKDYSALHGWRPLRWYKVFKFVRGGKSCVVASKAHTFFVSDGWMDMWGTGVRSSHHFFHWVTFTSNHAYCLHSNASQESDKVETQITSTSAPPEPPGADESALDR